MILLYDSDCRFCRWSVVWALDHDPGGSIEAVAITSAAGQRLLAGLSPEAQLGSVHLVSADGSRYSRGAAVSALLAALPRTRRLAQLTLISPRATETGYRYVADHRASFSRLLPSTWKQRADARIDAINSSRPNAT